MDNQNTQDNLITPPLYAFLDSCLVEKGIKDIPESLKEQMIKDLADRLQQWLMQSIFEHLPEEAAPEMEKLLATNPGQEEIMAFVTEKIPNITAIFKEEMAKFKQAYLGK